MAATGLKLDPLSVTTDPTTPLAGLTLVMTGRPAVIVSVLLAGCRTGAVAVRITEPIPVAVTCTGVGEVVCPAEMTTETGLNSAVPLPEMANVTVRAEVGATAVPTVNNALWPTVNTVVSGVTTNTGAGWTVRVVSPVTGPTDVVTVTLIVVVPTVKAVARPLLPMEATD